MLLNDPTTYGVTASQSLGHLADANDAPTSFRHEARPEQLDRTRFCAMPSRPGRLLHGYRPGSVATALLGLSRRVQRAGRASTETQFEFVDASSGAETLLNRSSNAAASDRRRFPRRESQSGVLVHCPEDPETAAPQSLEWLLHSTALRGKLVDICMQGVSFRLGQPIVVGQAITLRLANNRLDSSLDTPATVIRSTPIGNCWKIVCRFEKNLTYEQIHDLGRYLFTSTTV